LVLESQIYSGLQEPGTKFRFEKVGHILGFLIPKNFWRGIKDEKDEHEKSGNNAGGGLGSPRAGVADRGFANSRGCSGDPNQGRSRSRTARDDAQQ
jgi:hypothetical protein